MGEEQLLTNSLTKKWSGIRIPIREIPGFNFEFNVDFRANTAVTCPGNISSRILLDTVISAHLHLLENN